MRNTKKFIIFFSVGADKDYTHLRNHVWGDLKQRTLATRDLLAKTGSQGGMYSKLDELVLNTIGVDSDIVDGIPGVEEQWSADSSQNNGYV